MSRRLHDEAVIANGMSTIDRLVRDVAEARERLLEAVGMPSTADRRPSLRRPARLLDRRAKLSAVTRGSARSSRGQNRRGSPSTTLCTLTRYPDRDDARQRLEFLRFRLDRHRAQLMRLKQHAPFASNEK